MTYVTRKFIEYVRPHGRQVSREIPVTVDAANVMRQVEACGFEYSIERVSDEMYVLYISDNDLEHDFGTYVLSHDGNNGTLRDALSARIIDNDADALDKRRGFYVQAQIDAGDM